MDAQNKSEAKNRLEKLNQLNKAGINPYPNVTPNYITIEVARTQEEGETVAIVGRIGAIRGHGQSTFIDLTDSHHQIQLFFSLSAIGEKLYHQLKLFDI